MSIFELPNDIMLHILKDMEYKKNYNKLVREVYSKWRIETTESVENHMRGAWSIDCDLDEYWRFMRFAGMTYMDLIKPIKPLVIEPVGRLTKLAVSGHKKITINI